MNSTLKTVLISFITSLIVLAAGINLLGKYSPEKLNPGFSPEDIPKIVFIEIGESYIHLVEQEGMEKGDAGDHITKSIKKLSDAGFIVMKYEDIIYTPKDRAYVITKSGLKPIE